MTARILKYAKIFLILVFWVGILSFSTNLSGMEDQRYLILYDLEKISGGVCSNHGYCVGSFRCIGQGRCKIVLLIFCVADPVCSGTYPPYSSRKCEGIGNPQICHEGLKYMLIQSCKDECALFPECGCSSNWSGDGWFGYLQDCWY